MRRAFLLSPLLALTGVLAQGEGGRASRTSPPKLLVFVSVDQCAVRYVARFRPFLGEGGFLRLLKEGTYFSKASYQDAVTETGPGHAVLGTGTYPAQSGIAANAWLEGPGLRAHYCVAGKKGMSPANLRVPTLSDQWRKTFGAEARVLSLSLKDRAAILLGGRGADYVGWGRSLGTSPFFLERGLSETGKRARSVLGNFARSFRKSWKGVVWEPLWKGWKPGRVESLLRSGLREDDDPAERPPRPWSRSFPHKLSPKGRLLSTSPYGNVFLEKAAETLLEDSVLALGRDRTPDLLLLSFSSNDYIGHAFGPDSWEVADAFLRLDRLLARLLTLLDKRVGRGSYVFCLSADHGVAPTPGPGSKTQYLDLWAFKGKDPGKQGLYPRLALALAQHFSSKLPREFQPVQPFGAGRFRGLRFPLFKSSGREIYLRRSVLERYGIPPKDVASFIRDWMIRQPEVLEAATQWDLQNPGKEQLEQHPIWGLFKNAFFPGRSGEVFYALKAKYLGFLPRPGLSASHGTVHAYDREVPIFFLGAGVPRGLEVTQPVSVARMVPTAAKLFGIPPPKTCREAPLPLK